MFAVKHSSLVFFPLEEASRGCRGDGGGGGGTLFQSHSVRLTRFIYSTVASFTVISLFFLAGRRWHFSCCCCCFFSAISRLARSKWPHEKFYHRQFGGARCELSMPARSPRGVTATGGGGGRTFFKLNSCSHCTKLHVAAESDVQSARFPCPR